MKNESPRVAANRTADDNGIHALSAGRIHAFASSRVSAADLQELLREPEALFEKGDLRVIKKSPSTLLVRLTISLNG
ncbi:MAG: hypothetical protein CMJ46_07170, partial [Planctomyces sp.]|nr:hypothetical protein [Planctomyces sp.]